MKIKTCAWCSIVIQGRGNKKLCVACSDLKRSGFEKPEKKLCPYCENEVFEQSIIPKLGNIWHRDCWYIWLSKLKKIV